jgi:hypothetical protein
MAIRRRRSGSGDRAARVASEDRDEERVWMIGFIGWFVLLGALMAWEGIGLVREGDAWPTFSEMLRTITRHSPGRWILFGLWLWIGWHFFVTGWRFFLRG